MEEQLPRGQTHELGCNSCLCFYWFLNVDGGYLTCIVITCLFVCFFFFFVFLKLSQITVCDPSSSTLVSVDSLYVHCRIVAVLNQRQPGQPKTQIYQPPGGVKLHNPPHPAYLSTPRLLVAPRPETFHLFLASVCSVQRMINCGVTRLAPGPRAWWCPLTC